MQLSSMSFMNIESAEATLLRLRRRLLQLVLVVLAVGSLIFTLATFRAGGSFTGLNVISPLATLFALGLLLVVSRGYFIRVTGFIVISYLMVMGVFLYLLVGDIGTLFILLSLSSLTAALLAPRLVFGFFMLAIVVIVLASSVLVGIEQNTLDDSFTTTLLTIAFGLTPLAIGIASRYIFSQMEQTASKAQRSASLLAASADIGRNVSEMLDLDDLLSRSAEIIRDRFAFYHVSIFLVDTDHRYAHLTASTGDIGERMLARGHRLPIDNNSVVGRTAQALDVIVSRDTDRDGAHSFNELLPYTRSELGVPIINSDNIVGVVDIQSRRTDVFTSTEIDALRVIANQLATAIRNARLFEDKERSIRENKRLFIEAETNLREIQRLNRQLTRQAWSDYLRADRRIDGVTLSENTFNNTAEWSDEMISASRRRRPISEDKDGKRKIAVPIELRGEVVGAIEIETKPTNKKDDMVDMVRTVSQRLAVSLDNARLFEESHEATAQEQRVSEIVSQYQTADSVDDLLRVTIEGLAETLGAEQASIRLGVVPEIITTDSHTVHHADANGGQSA